MWFRIKVFGKGAHGGTRYEGVSAIEKSMIVVKHLLDLETARNIGTAPLNFLLILDSNDCYG